MIAGCWATSLSAIAAPSETQTVPVEPAATPGIGSGQSVAAYYNGVIRTMAELPVPSALNFRTKMTAQGAGVDVYDDDGTAVMAIGFGRNFGHEKSWETHFRQTGETIVTTDDGHQQKTTAPVFNPTWSGAYDWLRYGVKGRPTESKTSALPSAAPSPTQYPTSEPESSDATFKTIGFVQAISTAFYKVEDSGESPCPSGSSGRHLRLTAWRDPQHHPLTDAYVDSGLNRICALHFNVGRGSVFGVAGSYELDFGAVSHFWLVTGGESQLQIRMFGLGAKRVGLHFVYDFDPIV